MNPELENEDEDDEELHCFYCGLPKTPEYDHSDCGQDWDYENDRPLHD